MVYSEEPNHWIAPFLAIQVDGRMTAMKTIGACEKFLFNSVQLKPYFDLNCFQYWSSQAWNILKFKLLSASGTVLHYV